MAFVSFVSVTVFISGCSLNKDEKMREFLKKYGNLTAEKAYRKGGFVLGSDFKIDSLDVKSIKTEKVGSVTLHGVKAKLIYEFTCSLGGVPEKYRYYRWMALTIEEDILGEMLVDPGRSKEIVAAGRNEKEMKEMFMDKFEAGDKLVN